MRLTNSGSLENQWRTESATGNNDLLAGSEGPGDVLVGVQWLGRNGSYTDSTVTLQDDLVDLGVDLEVEVLVLGAGAVNVSVGGVGTTSSVTVSKVSTSLRLKG